MSIRVAFPFIGDTVGGSHISTASLMRALPEFGYTPVAVLHQDGPLAGWLEGRGVETLRTRLPAVSRAGGSAAIVRMAAIAPELALYLRRNGFALVHANDGRMITSWMPAARLARVKSVAHRRTKWAPSRLARLTLGAADAIITISDFVKDGLPGALKARALVVPNPFESDIPSRAEGRRSVIAVVGEDAPTVAFVGTLQKQKRPDIFLRAAAVILHKRPDARFLLIGRDGEIGEDMRRLAASLGLDRAVTFAGFRDDVLSLLAGSDVLLAPAVDEGHGRALVEAMLCGLPVVAAASGGHLEIVRSGETGVLVPPDDPAALAAAAIQLLETPALAIEMTAAASRWMGEKFSPRTHARAIAECYRGLLSA